MTPTLDGARRPAAAYIVMEGLLNPSYFGTPPPPQGVQLTIVGTDNIATTWQFAAAAADKVIHAVQSHPHLQLRDRTAYDSRASSR